jgi:hypothetical protein
MTRAVPGAGNCVPCNQSTTSQHSMQSSSSLPFSQEPPTFPYLIHTNPVHPTPSYLSKIHLNIIHPSRSWSSSYFTNLAPITYTRCFLTSSPSSPPSPSPPPSPHSCCMTCPFHPTSPDQSHYTRRRVQVMTLLVMLHSLSPTRF